MNLIQESAFFLRCHKYTMKRKRRHPFPNKFHRASRASDNIWKMECLSSRERAIMCTKYKIIDQNLCQWSGTVLNSKMLSNNYLIFSICVKLELFLSQIWTNPTEYLNSERLRLFIVIMNGMRSWMGVFVSFIARRVLVRWLLYVWYMRRLQITLTTAYIFISFYFSNRFSRRALLAHNSFSVRPFNTKNDISKTDAHSCHALHLQRLTALVGFPNSTFTQSKIKETFLYHFLSLFIQQT